MIRATLKVKNPEDVFGVYELIKERKRSLVSLQIKRLMNMLQKSLDIGYYLKVIINLICMEHLKRNLKHY